MCAHDQSSIFSTSRKFRPDYGLLLELHALTLVARSYPLLLQLLTIIVQYTIVPHVLHIQCMLQTSAGSQCNPQHGTCTCRVVWHGMACRPDSGMEQKHNTMHKSHTHIFREVQTKLRQRDCFTYFHRLVESVVEHQGVCERKPVWLHGVPLPCTIQRNASLVLRYAYNTESHSRAPTYK